MVSKFENLVQLFDDGCKESAVGSEYSIHQVAPYIGKIKSSIAKFLILNFTKENDTIFDPFCGAGTIPFESWVSGRNVIANDLNSYAVVLSKAKLFPPRNVDAVTKEMEILTFLVEEALPSVKTDNVPEWVSNFFHPDTLREIIAWVNVLRERESWFILSCLLGILHHQRPGFLSYPSSHTVPYLRTNKFPKEEFPELYEYRNVKERLVKKVKRALRRHPHLDTRLKRRVYSKDASKCRIGIKVDAVITSPPYMRQLDYARDNRLRLWFLGIHDHKTLDLTISPGQNDFVEIITSCLIQWDKIIKPGGKCILFLGDSMIKNLKVTLPDLLQQIVANEITNFKLLFRHESLIPNKRRVRRNHSGNKSETILVFQKKR